MKHFTPASKKCDSKNGKLKYEHSVRFFSSPSHLKFDIAMGPLPDPKYALEYAKTAKRTKEQIHLL